MSRNRPPLVAHVIYSLGTGGLENGLINIINRCPPERYRHVIICLTSAHEFAKRITTADVMVVELHKKDGHDPGIYWRLLKLLRQLRPDIIHSRNIAALETQLLGAFMHGVKQVHGEHGRDIGDLDGSNWKYRMLRKCMRLFIDRYIAVSEDLEQWLLQSIGVKGCRLKQIYNGVEQGKFKPRQGDRENILPAGFMPSPSTTVLGTVGRLAEVKDQALILKAVCLLLQENPALRDCLRVVIVGDGPLWAQLQQLIIEQKLDDVVWMAGDRHDVPQLLQAMDIFLLPSLAEGISNTVLEAMATGLPVIATDTGGNPELIAQGMNGFLVPVGNCTALVTAIKKMIDSPVMRKQMGQQGLDRIHEQFDWNRTVNEYLDIYDDLLGIAVLNAGKSQNTVSLKNMEVR